MLRTPFLETLGLARMKVVTIVKVVVIPTYAEKQPVQQHNALDENLVTTERMMTPMMNFMKNEQPAVSEKNDVPVRDVNASTVLNNLNTVNVGRRIDV